MSDRGGSSAVFGPWRAICLTCRTGFSTVGACDAGESHRVVDLMTREGQEALLDEVWTGPETVGPFGDLRPRGGPGVSLLPGRAPRRRGIAEGRPAPSPLGGAPCLAYGMALLTNRPAVASHDVLWREAATVGFSVRLDDSGLVRIPAGRVRFEVDRLRAYYAPRAQAAEHLPAGLGIQIAGEPDFVPFDAALEDILRPGDRVELLGVFELREDVSAERPSPRAPAPTLLVPGGTPVVRRID
jgi:hypothetical protein